jgi:hypothetical protein
MIGLFLALLELIREKLVWAKQPRSSPQIYLQSKTDEPAEEAVRKAILTVAETSDELSSQIKQQEPSKGGPIRIAEIAPKRRSAASPDIQKEEIKPVKEH